MFQIDINEELREALPLDYSFKKIENLTEVENITPREYRLGKIPNRGLKKKFLTKSLWLNNNNLKIIVGIKQLAVNHLEFPEALSWIDFAFNRITDISNEILSFENLTILYLHGNCIDNIETVIKLRRLPKLKRLSLHGNPISEIFGYRIILLYLIPQLYNLDFSPILNMERLSPAPASLVRRYQNLLYT